MDARDRRSGPADRRAIARRRALHRARGHADRSGPGAQPARAPFQGTSLEGEPLYSSLSRSAFGWTTSVSVPKAVLDGPVRASIVASLWGGAVLILGGLLAVLLVSRRVARDFEAARDAAAALAEGRAPALSSRASRRRSRCRRRCSAPRNCCRIASASATNSSSARSRRRDARGSQPDEGSFSGGARPRTAQPAGAGADGAGADEAARRHHAAARARRPGAADHAHDASRGRPARRLAPDARQGRSGQAAIRAGHGDRSRRRHGAPAGRTARPRAATSASPAPACRSTPTRTASSRCW